MKRYRKLQVIISMISIISLLLVGCSKSETTDSKVAEGDNTPKIKVVTTLFPQYDFVNQVGKDAVEVKMLLKPGVESHTYEPTPSDIIDINKADIFLYTGDEMEPWVSKILDSLDSDVMIVDLSKNITLDEVEDHDHDHEDEESDDDHVHSYDPHIWTNPLNAKVMVEDIKAALCEVDQTNAMTFENNAKEYLASLDQLDQDIRDMVKGAKRNEVVFGGRFAFHYFFEEYGLDYVSAYDSCSSETEPSAKVIATIIDKVKEDEIPVIFYEELANPKVAESIASATGTKTLLLHSCHNVSTDDYKNGATYLSLMYQNLENLKEALN